MRIIALSTLLAYARRKPDSAKSLGAWYEVARTAKWRNAADVKQVYGNASIVNSERIVFNIAGNKHRLIVAVNYQRSIFFIKFIGTHAEYDLVNAATVQHGEKP